VEREKPKCGGVAAQQIKGIAAGRYQSADAIEAFGSANLVAEIALQRAYGRGVTRRHRCDDDTHIGGCALGCRTGWIIEPENRDSRQAMLSLAG
jgi:hypothetical protein